MKERIKKILADMPEVSGWNMKLTKTRASELFYVGGANSIRAFTVRSIGPGAYVPNEKTTSYLDQTGDIKFLANLEYRPRLFGNLYGAVFLDAGYAGSHSWLWL